jgi:antitoxin (DNA-binding transcriptional repressor) of toxin-antitoxin stability system
MKGAIAEAAIELEAVKLGFRVMRPQPEGARYDLVIDTGPSLLRVQCKWAPLQGNVIVARAATSRHTPHGYVTTTYTADEIDGIGVYCQQLDRCYYMPIEVVTGQSVIHLRLARAANRQEAAINWATDYEFGAIAQLGERSAGSRKVGGSNPPSSIARMTSVETVRAHDFRERFGWYMERANAGQRVLVTRRGKPFVCLGPPGPHHAEWPGLAAVVRVRLSHDAGSGERADQRATLRLAGS